LRQAADSLERAPSPTQRELRAHTLAGTFRALGAAGGGPVAERVAEFAQAARDAVSRGIAVNQAVAFAVEMRRAGEILSRSGAGDEAALGAELAAVTAAVRALSGMPARAGRPAPPIVPIESLAPAPPALAPAPRTPRASVAVDEPVSESADLVGSWAAYQRLAAPGFGAASLDVLLQGPSLDAARPATPGHRPGVSPSVRSSADPGAVPRGDEVVDIRTLLYRGARARHRAQELREAAKRVGGDDLRAIIDEVCDLVVLAIEPQ